MSEIDQAIKVLQDPNTLKSAVDEIFQKVDSDNSGYIEQDELEVALKGLSKQLGIPEPTKKDIADSMKQIDENNDGKISKKELKPLIKGLFDLLIQELQNSK